MAYQPKTRNCNSNLYVVGDNGYGQLGLNHTNHMYIKQLTRFNNDNIDVAQIHVGYQYCIFESSQHKYYSAGWNEYGQCAVGSFDKEIIKCRHIDYFDKINKYIKKIFITPSGYSVFWLTTNNEIYANGRNDHCQLGINNDYNKSKPTIIIALKDIKDIQLGERHSVAMDNNGNVYGAGGEDFYGGYNDNTNEGGWTKIMFFENKQIKQIQCGYWHTLFLSADSCLYGAGENSSGELGQGDCADYTTKGPLLIKYFTTNYISVKDMCCGKYHNLAIDDKGRLYAWGKNEEGQCGINKSSNILSPQLVETLKRENITKIQCGESHSCVCSMKGKYFMFGSNDYNEVSLEQQKENKIFIPKYINDIVSEITNGKQIKNVCLGTESTFIFVSDSIQYENNEDEKSDDSDEKKEESAPKYKTMRKAKRKYEETTKSGEIKVEVGKIVGFIIAEVALLPVLANQLKNAVVNVSWSKSKTNEDIVEHFYHNNTYFFIELKRKVEKHGFSVLGISKQEFTIEVEAKWFYFEAKNISAKKKLAKLASDQATDAFDVNKFLNVFKCEI